MLGKRVKPEKIEDVKRAVQSKRTDVHTKRKNGRGLKALVIALFLVALGIFVFCFRDYINLYSIKKMFSSLDVGNYGNKSVSTIDLSYDSALSPLFFAGKDGLYIATGNRLTVKDYHNKELYDEMLSMVSPAVAAQGKYTLIYDRGGRELRLFSGSGLVYKGAASKELIAADINTKGQIATVIRGDGYRATVTITDEKQKEIYKWYSAERYVSAVAMSETGKNFCAVSLASRDGDIESRISFYDIEKDDPESYTDLPGETVFDLNYKDNGSVTAATDRALYVFSKEGKLISKYEYTDRVLQYFDINSEDYSVLVVGNHVYGTETSLVVLDNSLKVISDAEIGSEIDGISTDGRRILLTASESILVFNAYGDQVDTVSMPRGTREIVQNESVGAYAIQIDKAVPISMK